MRDVVFPGDLSHRGTRCISVRPDSNLCSTLIWLESRPIKERYSRKSLTTDWTYVVTRTVYISSTKYGPNYELSISRSWKECNQYAIDLLTLTIIRDATHQWNNIDLCFQREHQSLRYTIHSEFNNTQPRLCRWGGAKYGTKYYTDTELGGYITTQHSAKKCLSIPSTALCICNLCLTMPPYEFVQYPLQFTLIRVLTRRSSKMNSPWVWITVNVPRTRKSTRLNEPTSDNIDEHAYIHDISRNCNSNYRSYHPDNKRSISDYLMFMNGCLIGWCC